MTKTCYRVSPALEFSLDKLFLGKNINFTEAISSKPTWILKRGKRQYIWNASWCLYIRIAFYRVSKWFGSYGLRKIAVFGKLPQLIEISAYLTKIPTQFIHNLNIFLSS